MEQRNEGRVATIPVGAMVIEVRDLHITYGKTKAVDGVSFSIERGEVFAIVGPNGAGKTSTVEAILGLRTPTSGTISVLGREPGRHNGALSQLLGAQLQQAALPDRMKVWEALDLYASFYERTVDWKLLLEDWGLSEKRNSQFASLSGGQQQRLFIALALINDPEIVFLEYWTRHDEMNSGLRGPYT